MKRVVSIQDISCVGKCSLTVALPIISAMGVECGILPTAVLSVHTAFKSFTFDDLTDQIEPISQSWIDNGVDFDAIYTGYLGSFEQLELVSRFFDRHREDDTLIFVDPAMADNGALYKGFTPEFARAMGTVVCSKADIIDPNITEAASCSEPSTRKTARTTRTTCVTFSRGLSALGPKKAGSHRREPRAGQLRRLRS